VCLASLVPLAANILFKVLSIPCFLLGAFEIGWLVLDDSLLSDKLEPFLGRRGFLGYDRNELDPIFPINLHLLNCFAVETIGDLSQSMDVPGKTLLHQFVSQCPQLGAALLTGFGHCDAQGCLEFPDSSVGRELRGIRTTLLREGQLAW
jgi:hypothetical protein